jgi:7-methyl-GTP pyrophosphatase
MPVPPEKPVGTGAAHVERGLVLASSSPYRRDLLRRLGLPFAWCAPGVDESPVPGESPAKLVGRLAEQKVRAVAAEFPRHLIIGGDQLAVCDGTIVGKPLTRGGAIAQLEAASGRELTFLTSVSVLDSLAGGIYTEVVPCRVVFRRITTAQITNYVDVEQPLDCAGSFKCEGLGIALFERIDMSDPTVLTGLPLITLVALLKRHGLDVLDR